MSANTMTRASIVVVLVLIGLVVLLSLDNHPKLLIDQFSRSLRQIQQQERRRRRLRRVNTGCLEKVQSECAEGLIESSDGEELMKGLLSTCGLEFTDVVNLNRGWLYQWLLVDFLMVNYQNRKRYVCFDNGTDTATEIGGTASGWNTRPDLSYEIGTTPLDIVASSNPCSSWDSVNYTVRTAFWSSFPDAPYHNTYFYLGNGVFAVENWRWGNTLTQVGLPLDTKEVPQCMSEEDEDGYFIWEDTINLNPMLSRDPFTIMRNVFGYFLAFYDILTLNQDFIDEELTCDSL